MKINVKLTPETVSILFGLISASYKTVSDTFKMLQSDEAPTSEQMIAILEADKQARDESLARLKALSDAVQT